MLALDNEINGLTLGSVGRGTAIEYIQASYIHQLGFQFSNSTTLSANMSNDQRAKPSGSQFNSIISRHVSTFFKN